jgi:DNA-binding beta-propeller fold protein YncE
MNTGILSQTVVASLLMAISSSVCVADPSSAPPAPTPVQTGTAPFLFRTVPGWGAIPSNLTLGPTHGGIAVDRTGNVYVSTDNAAGIFVFARDGHFVKTIAPTFAGTHALLIRNENGTEYLYGIHLRRARAFKMALDGTPVLILPFPKASGLYGPNGEGYKPGAIAVAPDQSIFVADGYGSNFIHKYNPQGQYLGSFGGSGHEEGKFSDCHGLAIDSRGSGDPLLLVCDCDNRRLQEFDLSGKFVRVLVNDLGRPANVSFSGQNMAVAELEGRVTILDQNNAPVAYLGANPDQKQWADFRLPQSSWKEGVFVAPHGLCWEGGTGNLYVQDWSIPGRLTKLEPVR